MSRQTYSRLVARYFIRLCISLYRSLHANLIYVVSKRGWQIQSCLRSSHWLKRHRLVVSQTIFADAEKICRRRHATDFVQEFFAHAVADEVHEFFHAHHLRRFLHAGRDFVFPQFEDICSGLFRFQHEFRLNVPRASLACLPCSGKTFCSSPSRPRCPPAIP